MQKNNVKLLDLSQQKALPADGPAHGSESGQRVLKSMAPTLIHIVQEVQREIGLRGNESELEMARSDLMLIVKEVSEKLGFELSNFERDEVLEQIERSAKPFGILQELVDDPKTSDIIVTNYSKIAVQQGRRNLSTDLSFASQHDYEAFVERLLQKANSTYSTAKPIADGMIGAFARVHVVHRCLCESGPYLTIRLNRFSSVTISDLEYFGSAPAEIFQYLRAVVSGGATVLLAGEVGTGKTTLVRALAASFPTTDSILVIEDTPEIRLEHPHVRYVSTREANVDGAGRVNPAQCIRAGMRMAMNRIIFGEMRDAEAAEAFIDVCASGHPGLSTIHARGTSETIARLELFLGRAQKGVSRNVILEQVAKAVQVIVHVDICQKTNARRVMEVREIGPVADNVIRQREIFKYGVADQKPYWQLSNRSSAHMESLQQQGVNLSSFDSRLHLGERDFAPSL